MENMPLRVIDINFNLLCEIDTYSSLQWTRRWHTPGEFELHISAGANNADKLIKGNLVIIGSNVHKVGIIRYRNISQEDTEDLIIRGLSISSVIGSRITIPPAGIAYDSIDSNAETIMKHYVDANCVNPVDMARKIPQLIIAENKNRGESFAFQSRLKQLDIEMETISNSSGLGWDIYLDNENKKWVFDTFEGRNLTASQSILPPVIFSLDFDTVTNQTYTDSDIGYKNYGYVGGRGIGEDRSIVEVGGTPTGLNRFETFIDGRDLESDDDLRSRGLQKLLQDFKEVKTFINEINPYSSFVYGEDWDIGDVVTAQNKKWGITMDSRIIEVKEIYESDGFRIEATFGTNIPTIIEKVKIATNTPIIEKSTLSLNDMPTKLSQFTNDSAFIASSGAPVQSVAGRTGAVVLTSSDVGLGSVNNTADSAKNVLSATKLATVRTINGVNFDGTANITITANPNAHTHVITDVTNLQTALDGKVDDSQVLTNVPTGAIFTDTITTINSKTGVIAKADIVALGIPAQDTVYTHPTGDGNLHVPATSTTNSGKVLKAGSTSGSLSWGTLTSSDVGLENVTNTSDTNKPVSTAQQTALNLKANLASPTFTGTPAAPTPSTADSSTNIATTAFVKAQGYITSAGSGAKIAVASTAPTTPGSGDFWYRIL